MTTNSLAVDGGAARPGDASVERRSWAQRRWAVLSCQFLLLAIIVGVWQWQAHRSAYIREIFSSPSSVLDQLWQWTHGSNSHLHDLLSTLQGAATGFAVGTGAAIVCTLVFVVVPWTGRLFAPWIAAFNATPKVVLAPLFVLWFGVGLQAKTYFVASVIFFVMFYNMYVGVKAIDPIFLAQTRVLGARRLWELRVVFIPAMMGWIIVSLRVSVAFALLSAVVSEYLAASSGIGHLISLGESTLRSDQVLAGVVAVGIVTIVIDALLRAAESRLTRWRVR